ncbi:hypothetical protein [Ulvibacterium marinum]|uniref:Uncharacterized protein n=1 Tax=Ulvibacterium marinum TaxID=2419782 RepID=A0A3B0CHZ6_9FLAO|nr:hypothetical protein [Ulvibacterium marinum]RKN83486.1 hypothetical protein D7Z94_06620 [Ulvibacterium marinum]
MGNKTYRTCQNCGTVNLNKDYCQECGEIVNILLERKIERENKALKKERMEKQKEPNKVTVFFEKAKTHPNIVLRSIAIFFYSIWVIVLAIGSFFALLFGYIAA